jgi:uncharacterized protein YecT (DUF1311 family)
MHRGRRLAGRRSGIGKNMKPPLSWSVIVLIMLGCVLGCRVARADWFVAGAQYSCQPDSHLFEMIPYSTFSGTGDQSEHTPMRAGFRQVQSGLPITCAVAGHTLRTTVRIIDPYEGNGMGGGRVDIESMTIGTLKLSSANEYLDWDAVEPKDRLIRIRVTGDKGLASIERCYGSISLATGEIGKENINHCDTNKITTRPTNVATNEGGGVKSSGASFDCKKEGLSKVETTICADSELSQLDSQLGSIYAVAKATNEGDAKLALLKSQKAWLATRNRCSSAQCLHAAYDARITELLSTPNVRVP